MRSFKLAGRVAAWVMAAALAACGGGGGGGSTDSGFSVSYDRSRIDLDYEQYAPTTVQIQATAKGTPPGPVYVGATTPTGQPDPNIQQVTVTLQGTTGALVQVVPKPGLAPGNYAGTIVLLVCSDATCSKHYTGSPANLAYTLTVRGSIQVSAPGTPSDGGGVLQVLGRSLFLRGVAGRALTQTINVTLPAGLSSYTVTPRDSWAAVDQVTATGFRLSVPARAAGTYATTLLLQSGTTSATLDLQHIATPRPLTLDTTALALGHPAGNDPGVTGSGTIAVTQLSEGASGYTAVADPSAPWLGVTQVTAGSFTVTAAAMPSGNYAANVRVTSGSETVTVPVTWKVLAPAGGDRVLSVASASVTLTAPEGAGSGARALGLVRPSWNPEVSSRIRYVDGSGWLAVETLAGGDLQLRANAATLAAGSYAAVVTLTGAYPGTPVDVPVTLTVGPGLAVPAPQTLVLGSDSTAGQLAGSIPVASNGATALNWSATSNVPWLRLTRASGSLGTSVSFQVDAAAVAALPAYTDQAATVTISAQAPAAASGSTTFTPVRATVTLRNELAEVHYIGPGVVFEGQPLEVMVRGRGFERLADPAARLQLGGLVPTAVSRLGPNTLKVQLPAMAAGERTVSVGNALGTSTPGAVLRVLAAQAMPAAALETGGVVRTVLQDARRRQVLVAHTALGALQRWRQTASGWAKDSLAIPALDDIGFSPDGNWLVATESSGRLHVIDPATLTISQTYSAASPFFPTPGSGHGLPITNDGKVWLAAGTGSNVMVSFDLRTREWRGERPAGVDSSFSGGPWFEVSRNGERKVTVQTASPSPSPPLLYDDTSLGQWLVNPAGLTFFYWSYNGLDDTGSRLVVLGQVYDANFARIGLAAVPDAGWTDSAGVLSPDGRRLYVYSLPPDWQDPTSTQMPRIYAFDTSGAAGLASTLPLLGAWELPEFPTCHQDLTTSECFRPVMNIAPDGRTLMVAGTVKLLVVPVPPVLPSAQALRARPQMKLWMR